MSSNTAAVSSLTFSGGPNRWASSCRQFQETPIRLFLRKATAFFAKEAT
jgi:hypothetical protein